MKRVLIITYYWPPSGGAGVQRWLKFTKYLPASGWQPVVYTPENPEAPVNDPSLMEDIHRDIIVVRRPIWEPYGFYKRFMGREKSERINAGFLSESEKPRKKEGISVWIRGNLFIPDARRFWIRPSVRFLVKYLREHPVDAVISTGPPHSMHLIALKLKEKLKIPWVADFRDPWTEIDYYDQLRLTARSDRRHRELEKKVLLQADRVVAVGHSMAERFSLAHGIAPAVIPNGYDSADFQGDPAPAEGAFTILHVGAMNHDRNHPVFWEAVAELIREQPDAASGMRIRLAGKLDVSVLKSIEEQGLGEFVEVDTYLPHNRIVSLLQSASLLYLPINNTPNAPTILTGKIFEYLAARRPILGIGPEDGEAARILKECKAGTMVGFGDKTRVKDHLSESLRLHLRGEFRVDPAGIERYTRRSLASELAAELDGITGRVNPSVPGASAPSVPG